MMNDIDPCVNSMPPCDNITDQQYDDAMQSLIDYEKEISEHNTRLLGDLYCKDFRSVIDLECCLITEKIEWVDRPVFSPEPNPDVSGIFTLEFVDQWSVGMEGDSYEGFMYLKVDGYDKYLKIPYSC